RHTRSKRDWSSDVCSSDLRVQFCIGTDRSTGDSLGPLTGTFLTELNPKHLTIYGTLHHPVHATNMHEYIDKITKYHRKPFIIAKIGRASCRERENVEVRRE